MANEKDNVIVQPQDNFSAGDFAFAQKDEKLTDVAIKTKKIGYFADAMYRFGQNKGSIVAAVILGLMIFFCILTPFVTGYSVNESDDFYVDVLPKNSWFTGTGFWDGTHEETIGNNYYLAYSDYGRVKSVLGTTVITTNNDDGTVTTQTNYRVRIDTYEVGCKYKTFTLDEYEALKRYDDKLPEGEKIIQPQIDVTSWNASWQASLRLAVRNAMKKDANLAYQISNANGTPLLDANGQLQHCYKVDANGNFIYYNVNGLSYDLRINWHRYYVFVHGHEPIFILGSDNAGCDILTRLAAGGRLSLTLGFSVAIINIILGVIYGAIEGYYGGTADLVMERISEILSEVPGIIVISLFQIYLVSQHNVSPVISLFVAFIATGWIGTASTVRMQFYRYKNQDYVLAARTLGARDRQLIFRHIFPNSVGPLITSAVLMPPSVIFAESSLSYLGIIDFSTSNITSIGVMLNEGQKIYTAYPNVVLWPAIFISLLMICFNIFGNGLRDAFNPQLRGAGESA